MSAKPPPVPVTLAFAGRAGRLLKFIAMLERGIQVPEMIVSGELDLIRKSLDELEEAMLQDPERVRGEREQIRQQIDQEIAEAGGPEAWEQRLDLEMGDTQGSA